jgi:hypothetical protein
LNQKSALLMRVRHISFQASPTTAGSGAAASQPNIDDGQLTLSNIMPPPM